MGALQHGSERTANALLVNAGDEQQMEKASSGGSPKCSQARIFFSPIARSTPNVFEASHVEASSSICSEPIFSPPTALPPSRGTLLPQPRWCEQDAAMEKFVADVCKKSDACVVAADAPLPVLPTDSAISSEAAHFGSVAIDREQDEDEDDQQEGREDAEEELAVAKCPSFRRDSYTPTVTEPMMIDGLSALMTRSLSGHGTVTSVVDHTHSDAVWGLITSWLTLCKSTTHCRACEVNLKGSSEAELPLPPTKDRTQVLV